MRILLLNYEYPPLGGGAGVATAALARQFAQRGIEVDVVTAAGGPDGAKEERADAIESGGGIRLHRVRSRRTGVHEAGMGAAADYLRSALPVVRHLIRVRRPEVAHFFFSLPTGALLLFAGLRKLPTVVSLRGSDVPGYDLADAKLQTFHSLLRPLTLWIWRKADRVVALSEGLGKLALRTDPSLRYTVIHNGVDVRLFRPPPAAKSEREQRVVRCLAVARLVERKGLADLLHALHRLPRGRFELEIVGSGHDEHALHRLARQLQVEDRVRFVGAVEHAAVAAYYRRADLFTLAPANEAFGNVFAEALASGLPIVGSEVGGIPEFVEDGVNGLLVPPGDPGALAAAIQRLGEDPRRRLEMSIRNRTKAEETLSWSSVADRYLEVYSDIAVRTSGQRPLAAAAPA